VRIRHGRTTTLAGDPEGDTRASGRLRLTRPQYGQDCKLSECKRHVCTPMAKSTIRIILSGDVTPDQPRLSEIWARVTNHRPPWFPAHGRAFAAPYAHGPVVLATHHEDYFPCPRHDVGR
jgi:hypothetical protein